MSYMLPLNDIGTKYAWTHLCLMDLCLYCAVPFTLPKMCFWCSRRASNTSTVAIGPETGNPFGFAHLACSEMMLSQHGIVFSEVCMCHHVLRKDASPKRIPYGFFVQISNMSGRLQIQKNTAISVGFMFRLILAPSNIIKMLRMHVPRVLKGLRKVCVCLAHPSFWGCAIYKTTIVLLRQRSHCPRTHCAAGDIVPQPRYTIISIINCEEHGKHRPQETNKLGPGRCELTVTKNKGPTVCEAKSTSGHTQTQYGHHKNLPQFVWTHQGQKELASTNYFLTLNDSQFILKVRTYLHRLLRKATSARSSDFNVPPSFRFEIQPWRCGDLQGRLYSQVKQELSTLS